MQQSRFSLQRLWNLIKIDIKFSIKSIALSLLVPLVFFFFMSLNPNFTVFDMLDNGLKILRAFIIIGGVFFTSYAFADMHSRSQNHFWYVLPANSLEKFIAKLLFNLVFYFIFIVVGFGLIMSIGQLFFEAIDFSSISYFIQNIFIPKVAVYYKRYLFYASIILLGAAFFRKSVIINTFISIFVMVLLIVAISYVISGGVIEVAKNTYSLQLEYGSNIKMFISDFNIYIYMVFILFLWILTYFVMKRTQVSDGI